mmetsp:Transcript_65424/g.58710  ORF Transcript_65424/g.58710 Transcript_65424/m.58710 type:complete len:524 (+) Transcript_65424:34-1605(+)|eukprot:CAMPEP_0201570898 /NCGR_PEP_ID=MMETSP0190_2-20130828/13364_1 /ASSEMBLY_ACC=CAM_ASM_000263 /TAXON_ID=37353 /ORGANISM="Rosalina sp." /LENGTH=523 /DNA_ID=CAMNT_0047994941 /DNA_START=77 /DNA_END=1648 /DNA_ORIENTATION=-
MRARLNILGQFTKSQTSTNEQAAIDNLDKIQTENDTLKAQIKSLQLTIQTYQDENGKFISEKEELMKQMTDLREKSEQTASTVFLKSEAMTNLKQELNGLTEDNINYTKQLNDLQIKLKEFETENNELKEKNTKYEKSLNESRLNEDTLTQKLSKQSAELLELKNILQEFQTKYDHLFIENSCFQQENEQLKDTADEIQLITRTNNGIEPSAPSIKWRYQKTMTDNAKMEECLNELHLSSSTSVTITPSSYKHGGSMTVTNTPFNIITPITPKLHTHSTRVISPRPNASTPRSLMHSITPKSSRAHTLLSPNGIKKPFVYNFESTDFGLGTSPRTGTGTGHNNNTFMAPPPSNLPLLNATSGGFDEIEESPAESLRTMEEHESMSIQDDIMDRSSVDEDGDGDIKVNGEDRWNKQREELDAEWRKKCEDLKAENESLRKLCDEYRNKQSYSDDSMFSAIDEGELKKTKKKKSKCKKDKDKDKMSKMKEMEDKARAYDLKTSRFGCNGYLVFNCFSNKGMKDDC